jgi:hypothetical protein
MNYIVKWFESKGGFAHVAVGTYAVLQAAYFAVPPFHNLITTAFQQTPSWVHDLILSAIGIAAWYKSTQKPAMEIDPPKETHV